MPLYSPKVIVIFSVLVPTMVIANIVALLCSNLKINRIYVAF